jgi:hypothetical protein
VKVELDLCIVRWYNWSLHTKLGTSCMWREIMEETGVWKTGSTLN